MYLSHVFVWNQDRACAPLHKKAENSWKRRIQASKFITKHACIGRTYLRWKQIKSRVDMPASTRTRPLHWREPHCEFVALDLEALDVKIALDFRAFVLRSCTLYTVKKNEALNRRPHFISRNPLLQLTTEGHTALSTVWKTCHRIPKNEYNAQNIYNIHNELQ